MLETVTFSKSSFIRLTTDDKFLLICKTALSNCIIHFVKVGKLELLFRVCNVKYNRFDAKLFAKYNRFDAKLFIGDGTQ